MNRTGFTRAKIYGLVLLSISQLWNITWVPVSLLSYKLLNNTGQQDLILSYLLLWMVQNKWTATILVYKPKNDKITWTWMIFTIEGYASVTRYEGLKCNEFRKLTCCKSDDSSFSTETNMYCMLWFQLLLHQVTKMPFYLCGSPFGRWN